MNRVTVYYFLSLAPRPNVYVYCCPIHINFDQKTCVWVARFARTILSTIDATLATSVKKDLVVYLVCHCILTSWYGLDDVHVCYVLLELLFRAVGSVVLTSWYGLDDVHVCYVLLELLFRAVGSVVAAALYPIGKPVRATITLYPIGRPVRARLGHVKTTIILTKLF